ncbi:MAG: hypothetical protein R3C44_16880 [Chloroflexota bacterium]
MTTWSDPATLCPPAAQPGLLPAIGGGACVRINSIIELDEATAGELSRSAARIAHAEGLTAHARSAEYRVTS